MKQTSLCVFVFFRRGSRLLVSRFRTKCCQVVWTGGPSYVMRAFPGVPQIIEKPYNVLGKHGNCFFFFFPVTQFGASRGALDLGTYMTTALETSLKPALWLS